MCVCVFDGMFGVIVNVKIDWGKMLFVVEVVDSMVSLKLLKIVVLDNKVFVIVLFDVSVKIVKVDVVVCIVEIVSVDVSGFVFDVKCLKDGKIDFVVFVEFV